MTYKKYIIYIVLTILFFWFPLAHAVFGAEKTAVITWTLQDGSPAPTNFKIYQADNGEMTGATSQDLQVDNVNPYTATFTITAPNNALSMLYFAMTACNESGCSGYSNIVPIEIDTRPAAPATPFAPAQVEIRVIVSVNP